MISRLLRGASVCFCVLVGCSAGGGGEGDPTESSSDSIIGGKLASEYPEAAYVNIDWTGAGGYVCSAALIAPKVVLTAGHCVDAHKTWEVHVGAQTRTSTSAATYDWKEGGATTVNPNHHDVGLIFLDSAITIASYPTIASAPLAANSKVTNVGRINNGVVTNALYAADSVVSPGAAIGYPFDYSSPTVIQAGDSGGPDFASGTHTIVAVNSGSSPTIEVLARVDLVRDWILAQIASHGGLPATTPAAPACPLDVEPNNTFAKAAALPTGATCGALTASDEDWYAVSVTGAVTLSIATSGDALLAVGQASGTTCTATLVGLRSLTLNAPAAQKWCVRVISSTRAAQSYTITRS